MDAGTTSSFYYEMAEIECKDSKRSDTRRSDSRRSEKERQRKAERVAMKAAQTKAGIV